MSIFCTGFSTIQYKSGIRLGGFHKTRTLTVAGLVCNVTALHSPRILLYLWLYFKTQFMLPCMVSFLHGNKATYYSIGPIQISSDTASFFKARPSCPSKHDLFRFLRYEMLHEVYVGSFDEWRHVRWPFWITHIIGEACCISGQIIPLSLLECKVVVNVRRCHHAGGKWRFDDLPGLSRGAQPCIMTGPPCDATRT